MPSLVVTTRAGEDIRTLPEALRKAVDDALLALREDPTVGKTLTGELRGARSLRIGSYRVLYTLEGSGAVQRIVVRAVRHWAVAYRRRRRRR